MKKEQKWEFIYEVPTANGETARKTIYPKSKEKIEANKTACAKYGYRVVSVKKLYPFNTYGNQHNFELIANICFNRMWDMDHGEEKYDNKEYMRLQETREKAERFFCLPLPVAWIPYEDWKDAKEISTAAILHREKACIEAGHTEYLQYV